MYLIGESFVENSSNKLESSALRLRSSIVLMMNHSDGPLGLCVDFKIDCGRSNRFGEGLKIPKRTLVPFWAIMLVTFEVNKLGLSELSVSSRDTSHSSSTSYSNKVTSNESEST